jgi:hypothetical protein
MYYLLVKEEEYAVPSVSRKRTATAGPAPKVKRSVESLAPSTSNNKDAVSSKNAASKTFKAATTLRVGKTVSLVLVKFLVMVILKAIIIFFLRWNLRLL